MLKKLLCKRHKAFTLIEMSIVLFIISLLILIVLPNLSQQRKSASKVHSNAMVSVVQTQIDAYENENGTDDVDYATLESNNYLTASQVKKARGEHIAIIKGRAIQK
ncbi:MAG: competence type IV pilus major pilin ComGC [Limosilactobacillus sp.]|uniref:competence type IV pilus major pilin ComGC n=1 Tax=Limosilactobacillus sp. TaxID=2773925 RepID=UPI0026FFBA0D|nr:competence type IV pilus major pilin ComGC [Limosilactobacillus sp.]